jgi:hypothetical protein
MIPKWALVLYLNNGYDITSIFWTFQFTFDYNIDNIVDKLKAKPKVFEVDLFSGPCILPSCLLKLNNSDLICDSLCHREIYRQTKNRKSSSSMTMTSLTAVFCELFVLCPSEAPGDLNMTEKVPKSRWQGLWLIWMVFRSFVGPLISMEFKKNYR